MLSSQREIVEQARAYLRSVTERNYVQVIRPQHQSSAGAHMRHILDHYQALMTGAETGLVDYDARHRGDRCEQDPRSALLRLDDVEQWLRAFDSAQGERSVRVRTEISVSAQRVVTVQSTLARELVFVGSHAVHHYAMIGQISLLQGRTLDVSFGVAPATASFLRDQACAR